MFQYLKNNLFNRFRKTYIILISILLTSCATYYAKTIIFQEAVQTGNFAQANKELDKGKKWKRPNVRVLYELNKGYVNRMLSKHDTSITHFANADRLIEDYSRNWGLEAVSLISNPMSKPYRVEDFENVMVNYYQAFNYININKFDEAIVECKRINNKLNTLNDKYKDHKNRYQRDAFAMNLMGILYEANYEYNDAFIAYRNAYETYKTDYATNFGVAVPEQLKKDLLRTAYLNGFISELGEYEKEFNMKYQHQKKEYGEAIIFWENGFGPIKEEWSINFASTSRDGVLYLDNPELGLAFHFNIGHFPRNQQYGFNSLSMMRIAFPKYETRKPICTQAKINHAGKNYNLEMAENINEIAFKTLHDRMLRELGAALLRLATKKAIEIATRNQDQTIGTLVSIANAVTEKADTRNWQTLPYSVSYSRIPLKEGSNSLEFTTYKHSSAVSKQTFTFEGKKGKTHFHTFHSLETLPPRQ